MKYNRNVYHALTMISQFGINMLVPIFICAFIGMAIDKKCGTSFWVVILFFVGAIAGFRNVFLFAKKIYDTPAQTRRHYKAGQKERAEENIDEQK
ncbi:MAG: AtpZ/AtpI family protein [Lachnospiraceae bacterium]|nr:AtpZ/AtpI family protein [Lachnospiraceae bacterium]